MSLSEPMGWPAFMLIMLIVLTTLFGKKGKRRGYTRTAPSPKGPRPRPPGTEGMIRTKTPWGWKYTHPDSEL